MAAQDGFWRGSLYFAAIGLAFMLVEIPLIQKAILHLGHPSHAMSVVLASMLLGASAGSLCAGRTGIRAVRRWGGFAVLALAAANFGLSGLLRETLGWPFPSRALLMAAVSCAMGFFMGFPFPAGMIRFGEKNRPWFWAMNGALSVTAGVLSLVLSMRFGFTAVGLAGACAYALAWLLLASSRNPRPDSRTCFDRKGVP